LTGSFTVTQITFATGGAVETFDADFEQHCEGANAALRGHVHVVNAPPPPPLSIALALNPDGSATSTGTATVSGTVTCNAPATVYLSGELTQRATRFALARGHFWQSIACSGKTPWQATVSPENSVPFNSGRAQLSVNASGYDPEYAQNVTDAKSADIKLRHR
jgi:hypothetical protein